MLAPCRETCDKKKIGKPCLNDTNDNGQQKNLFSACHDDNHIFQVDVKAKVGLKVQQQHHHRGQQKSCFFSIWDHLTRRFWNLSFHFCFNFKIKDFYRNVIMFSLRAARARFDSYASTIVWMCVMGGRLSSSWFAYRILFPLSAAAEAVLSTTPALLISGRSKNALPRVMHAL
jgi:hypothetical protein